MPLTNISLRKTRKTARAYLRASKIAPMVALAWFISVVSVCGVAALMREFFFAPTAYIPAYSEMLAYTLACVASLLLVLFLIYPFYCGIDMLVMGYVLHKKIEWGSLFSFYTAANRYRYAVRIGAERVLRFFFCGATLWVVMRFGRSVASSLLASGDISRAAFVLCGTFLFLGITLWAFWCISATGFMMSASIASAPSLSYRQIKVLAKRTGKYWRRKVFWHQAMLLPLFIVSVLLFCVPLIFVIPYAKMSKCVLSRALLQC